MRFDEMTMKTGKHRSNAGSVLTIILITVVIIGITLGSYLGLVSNQNLSVHRSLAWNSAIPIAEAGIEEALAHLNRNGTNRIGDGWLLAPDGTNVWRTRTIGDEKYEVYINAFVEPPAVLAHGYVRKPMGGGFLEKPRTVRVTTTNDALFAKGIVAKGQIDLAGNNIRSDSFDSTDPLYNTGGRYDPAKNKANGDIATNSAVIDSLNVWNAEIYGKASTGPGGNIKIGSNGSVGSKAWVDGGNKGIQPGWTTDDMNVDFPDVQAPFSSGWSVTYTGGNYVAGDYGSGNYMMNSLSMSGTQKLLVTNNVVLYVKGSVSITGGAYIEIAAGASLSLYVGGSTTYIAGNGVVNANTSASTFSYWGLNSNTKVSMSGNASFTGTLYAPYANLTLGGGGSNSYDFAGAVVANQVKMNGHYQFHYDEALGAFGPRRGYTIVSWRETAGWEEL